MAKAISNLVYYDPLELVRSTCRESFYEFVKAAWRQVEGARFVDNWHIKAICEHLQAVTEGKIQRLLINIPPGCSKSLLTCVFWPMWEWSIDSGVRWLFASYDQKLSTRDSVKCRALLKSEWYRKHWPEQVTITGDQNQKTYYETAAGGYRLATSIGGHGTGEHPDRIVVDDPHNVEQAESEVERQSVIDWWNYTISTRGVSRNARRVIIMQRLHHQDLSATVLAEGDWTHVCLAMRHEVDRMPATPLGWNDPRGEKEGELLTPKQFNADQVTKMERQLGAYGTAGQLQQRPVPKGGGMFKAIYFNQRVKAAPYNAKRILYIDRASTQDGGCYTAMVLMAYDLVSGNWFVEHVVHGQWEPDERNNRILAEALRCRTRYGPRYEPVIWVEAEGGSSGRDAWKALARKLAGFVVKEDKVTGKKDVRAEPWAAQLAAGNVYMVEDGSWDLAGYIQEHELFKPQAEVKRLGKYKDQVDASSGAFNLLLSKQVSVGVALRSYSFGINTGGPSFREKNKLRIVVCDGNQLANTIIEERAVVVSLRDPSPIGNEVCGKSRTRLNLAEGSAQAALLSSSSAASSPQPISTIGNGGSNISTIPIIGNGQSNGLTIPLHGCSKLLGHLWLDFADFDPAEHQEAWREELGHLIMNREHGKRLWAFLTKKRDPSYQVIVIQDDGERDRRAISMACAVADALGQKRTIIYSNHEPERSSWQPTNNHVFQQVKATRNMVVT